MKKTAIILGISVLSGFSLLAQDAFDAVKMSSYDIKGSARYMSMGGAFVSLGGDASAIQDNPRSTMTIRAPTVNGTGIAVLAFWTTSRPTKQISY